MNTIIDRVFVLRDTDGQSARDGVLCAVHSEMSLKTTTFRASVVLGLATVVAAILWFTPAPCKYLAVHSGGPGFQTLLDNCIATL